MKTISEVLVGVATLGIREPNDARAEYSTIQKYAGDRSVKLYKGGSGNAGSTHLEVIPPTKQTLTAFVADPTDYSFWYWYSVVTGNFVQFELRFEDPDTGAWVEVTVVPHQNTLGIGSWLKKSLAGADLCGIGGVGEEGESFFDWDLGTSISTLITDIDAQTGVTDSGPWTLRRVRLELWEPEPERTAYVDSIELDGTVYTIEPGGTAPGMSLSSPFITVGYTEDGVTFTYTADQTDVEVEEETVPIDRVITKETIEITCNMAQSSLYNLSKAIAGSVLSGSILTIGAGVNKKMNLKLVGKTPDDKILTIFLPLVTATGVVGTTYRHNEKNIVPVTFQALKPANEPACTIVYNAA